MSKILFLIFLIGIVISLLPRQPAPSFSGTTVSSDKSVKIVDFKDYRGKYVVLLFYPFDFTYVCPTELLAFSDKVTDFRSLGAQVLTVSVDSQFSHLAWMNTERAKGGVADKQIPMVSDITKEISKAYQVLVTDNQDQLLGASLRGLFIVDDKGIIRSLTINDASVGRSVDETLRTIQALQHADKHGIVCPADWKPGLKTIIPDQVKKEEYFNDF